MIPREQWKTHGVAAHFICQEYCRYRLSTVVGCVVVSTVGDYHPPNDPDDGPPKRIGASRFYETMVFALGEDRACSVGGACSCVGMPGIEVHRNLDFHGYKTALEASAGHDAMCVEWSSDEKQAEAARVPAPQEQSE